jgi:hypothetical protein
VARIFHPDGSYNGTLGPVGFTNGVADTQDHSAISYAVLAGWKVDQDEPEPVDPAELKGAALDAALDAAGLSKDGKADEKRQRLAEHAAAQD